MKVAIEKPPNYADIVAAFPIVKRTQGVLFCWGETIFNPDNAPVGYALVAHERAHSERQAGAPAKWWDRYLIDPQFRFDEELAGHRAEYQAVAVVGSEPRNVRRQHLSFIAKRLSGPLYGGVATYARAREMIRHG